ncbi:putative D,D-dipeptide-binding periplasmic protein DdpA [Thermoflexales bacterium]|nr:putative D,D-dipeptide-binding periplasmic protein DdpA [Thermoflexales bacterium]
MPDRNRRLNVGTLLLIVMLALVACSSAPTKLAPTTTPTVTRTKAPTATPTVTPTPEPPQSRNPGALIYLTGREPDTLDPQLDYTSAGAGVLHNIYETLVTYDKTNPSKLVSLLAEYVPGPVAADDGGVTYTFIIPDGIKFHQGGEVSAEDVAYSLWRLALSARTDRVGTIFEAPTRTPGFLLLDALFGVDDAALLVDATGKFMGDPEFLRMAKTNVLQAACTQVKAAVTFDNWGRSVVIKLPRPYAPLLAVLSTPGASIVSRQWMIEQGEWDGDCQTWQYFYGQPPAAGLIRTQANGTGPYQLDHWTPGAEIVLTANAGYRQGPPRTDRVELKTIGNFDQRLQLLRVRDADLIEAGTPEQLARLDELVREHCDLNGQCELLDFNGLLRRYPGLPSIVRHNVFFNFALPEGSVYAGSGQLDGQGVPLNFFADVHVRRAFNACFDRGRFITDTLAGQGEVPRAITLPDQPGYAASPPADFDPARCAEEFKAVEFRTPDDLTLWDVGFMVQLPYRDGDGVPQAVVDQLAQNLTQLNAKFVVTPVAISTLDWLRELRAGQIPLAVMGWQADLPDPHNWYRPYLFDTYTARFHLPEELAQKYQALIDQGAAELDDGARAVTYAALNAALHDDAALILLPAAPRYRYEPVYLKGWLNGLSMNPLLPDPGYVYEYNER